MGFLTNLCNDVNYRNIINPVEIEKNILEKTRHFTIIPENNKLFTEQRGTFVDGKMIDEMIKNGQRQVLNEDLQQTQMQNFIGNNKNVYQSDTGVSFADVGNPGNTVHILGVEDEFER